MPTIYPIKTDQVLKNRIDKYFKDLETTDDLPTIDGLALFIGESRTFVNDLFKEFNIARDYFASLCITRCWDLAKRMDEDTKKPLYSPRLIEFYLKNNFGETYKSDSAITKSDITTAVNDGIKISLTNDGENPC